MRRSQPKVRRVLGIMSGTSIDAVDYAICDITDQNIRVIRLWQASFPAKLQERLHSAAAGICSAHDLAQLHHDLGRFYAVQARPALKMKPQLVGLHGQTVFHRPDSKAPATLQIGEPAWLAETLRVPVISNFRSADLAAGGQGAPLATVFHRFVFAQRGRHVCVNNLGGISNITSIDWRHGARPRITAFDTGPASVLLDLASRHFSRGQRKMDRDGAWASRGSVDEALVDRWMRHPFFVMPPPKSTGREVFGEVFWNREWPGLHRDRASRFDVLASLTRFTARSIADACEHHLPSLPDRVILTGGGAANPVLKRFIVEALHEISHEMLTLTSADIGWPLQSIEPAAFALLAWLRFQKKAGNLPETTGANRSVLLGQISEP